MFVFISFIFSFIGFFVHFMFSFIGLFVHFMLSFIGFFIHFVLSFFGFSNNGLFSTLESFRDFISSFLEKSFIIFILHFIFSLFFSIFSSGFQFFSFRLFGFSSDQFFGFF